MLHRNLKLLGPENISLESISGVQPISILKEADSITYMASCFKVRLMCGYCGNFKYNPVTAKPSAVTCFSLPFKCTSSSVHPGLTSWPFVILIWRPRPLQRSLELTVSFCVMTAINQHPFKTQHILQRPWDVLMPPVHLPLIKYLYFIYILVLRHSPGWMQVQLNIRCSGASVYGDPFKKDD